VRHFSRLRSGLPLRCGYSLFSTAIRLKLFYGSGLKMKIQNSDGASCLRCGRRATSQTREVTHPLVGFALCLIRTTLGKILATRQVDGCPNCHRKVPFQKSLFRVGRFCRCCRPNVLVFTSKQSPNLHTTKDWHRPCSSFGRTIWLRTTHRRNHAECNR
jgi:hypothetical protein